MYLKELNISMALTYEMTGRMRNMLEVILSNKNIGKAYKKVIANKGAPGTDGITVDSIGEYLHENWQIIKSSILNETYKPMPVRRVEIPKPNNKGIRILGIPTVLDRIIQQAITQIISPIFDKDFSNSSYGFREKRDAKQAIEQAHKYINEGYDWVVDIDLEKYFDTVNHDILMNLVSKKIKCKQTLKLIRKYLKSGVMINGVVVMVEDGCPQGSPLSPLLSNIMLDTLDKELERRGHKFCRYADDNNVFVASQKAGERVMTSLTNFLENKMRLKVNKEKSAVGRPWERKFLGFTFYKAKSTGKVHIKIHKESISKFKNKVKKILSRSNGISMNTRLKKLNEVITGWINYFKITTLKSDAETLDGWIRRRIRMCIWKQWKNIGTRAKNLIKLKVPEGQAWRLSNSRKSYWAISGCTIIQKAISNKRLEKRGLKSLKAICLK